MSGELVVPEGGVPFGGVDGVTLMPVGLSIEREIPFEEYEEIGRILGGWRDLTAWAIGDWLIAGKAMFGELAAQAATATRRSETTLEQYEHVAENVPHERRLDHALVDASSEGRGDGARRARPLA